MNSKCKDTEVGNMLGMYEEKKGDQCRYRGNEGDSGRMGGQKGNMGKISQDLMDHRLYVDTWTLAFILMGAKRREC